MQTIFILVNTNLRPTKTKTVSEGQCALSAKLALIVPLLLLVKKIVLFLPFNKKKKEKGFVFFFMFVCILNVLYTFKFRSAFGNQKCVLKIIKSAILLVSAPCCFFRLKATLVIIFLLMSF